MDFFHTFWICTTFPKTLSAYLKFFLKTEKKVFFFLKINKNLKFFLAKEFFVYLAGTNSKLPPSPKDCQFAHSKNPYWCSNLGDPYVKNPGYRDFKRPSSPRGFFWLKSLVTFWWQFFLYICHQKVTKLCSKKNPEHQDFKSQYWKPYIFEYEKNKFVGFE